MRIETQNQYFAMLKQMAAAYGVDDARDSFAATVPMAQKLNDAIQASIAFLKMISILPVDDIKGEVLDMQIHSTIAGRTDTSGEGERAAQTAGAPDGRQYECKQTNFDVAITYALLDAWARYGNFKQRYMAAVYHRIGLDRILIGWNGASAAATTDRATNPLLQDVNKGWLYDLETNNAGNYLSEVVAESGEIKIGSGAGDDYRNVDQLVFDVYSLIPEHQRTGNEVAIVGEGLVTHDMNKVLGEHAETPTEKNALKILSKSYGSLRSLTVPQFPANGLLVTDLRNLQLYYQRTSLRRKTEDQPAKNRIVDFISQNEAYMIGNLNAAAGIDASAVVLNGARDTTPVTVALTEGSTVGLAEGSEIDVGNWPATYPEA